MGAHYAHRRLAGQQQGRHYSNFCVRTEPKCLNLYYQPAREAQIRARIREDGLGATLQNSTT